MAKPSSIKINQADSQTSTGQLIVMPAEDLRAYQRHLASFTVEYHPQGATEANLVQALADTSWRLNRVAVLEANLLTAPDASLESQCKALSNLSLHTQRLSRQFERTVAQLRDLQKTRVAEEKRAIDNFLDVREMFEKRGETYDPSDDGFVFSEDQINQAIYARNRERVIQEAHDDA